MVLAVKITQNPNTVMQYVNYEEDIVQRYGIVLEGWTFARFVNPSELSTVLPPLQKLLNVLNDGSCKFMKLTREQHKAHEKEYHEKVVTREIQVHERKTKKDAGQKWKRKVSKSKVGLDDETSSSKSSSDEVNQKKHCHAAKSKLTIESSDEDD